MRARRALLTTAADPTPLRRSLSPARSSSDRAPSLDTPLASRQLSPLRRVAVDPGPVPADLTQFRRGILDRLPRLGTVPRNYADLRAFLQAMELAIQALDRPADAFHITMQQLHPRLQAHIRTCMTAQPEPTRTPYDHIVPILIQQVAPSKPEDYLHQTIALIARRANTQISCLHMQFTEAYDAYRDLCARLRSPPHLADPPADTTLAVPRASATPPARRPQRTAPTPSELLREPPPASWAAAIHHLNQQAPCAPPQPTALNSPVAMTRPPAPSLGRCFFCNAPDHGHRVCPSYLRACQQDPTLASKCPACRAPGFCPVSCPRRQYFIRSTRFPYLEVDRFGHSYYIRADLPSPAWFHPGLLPAVLAHERPTPQAPPQPSVAVVQRHPDATDALPPPPDTADPRPATPPPADPPVAQRAVFCAAPPAPGAVAPPTAICNHTRLGTPARTPKAPTYTRAWATIDGIRCEVIIDTGHIDPITVGSGARLCHGRRVPLDVRLSPLKTTASFFVVPGVAFAALLGVDFLYEHESRSAWPVTPCFFEGHASTLPGVGLTIAEHLTSGPSAIRNTADHGLYLSEGWPLARAVRLPPTAIHTVRLVATDPASPPEDGAADAPSYERVSGGFIPTLPSPNSCLLPAELQQLRDLLHEFRDRFNDGSEPLPATTLVKARLDTGDAPPNSTPPRRLSPAVRQAVRKADAELDAQGITEPSTGCWSIPIVMVRKGSGAWRLCCDYRAINKHVPIPQQPLLRTDDILASFNGQKYFSVLDMCKGFYQIEIADEDRPKTSFVTPDCQRQYRRLPFGFASSPAMSQRMVDLLLGGMKWVSAVGYIGYVDDIIVYSDTWDAHRAHLRQLFQAFRDANLQLHPGKCSFGAAAVRYLGHIVSRDGIKPCPSKLQAILEVPVPKTAKAVQRFLGKCRYYRKFIPNFSITDAPLFQAAARQKDFT
ncbi:hypothetical protein Emag_006266 [Eimeria magna]